jgi:hypothetical protein
VQQLSGDMPPKAPPPVVPSRFSPANMSFTGLFRNVPEDSPVDVEPAGNSAFFTQLYGQE